MTHVAHTGACVVLLYCIVCWTALFYITTIIIIIICEVRAPPAAVTRGLQSLLLAHVTVLARAQLGRWPPLQLTKTLSLTICGFTRSPRSSSPCQPARNGESARRREHGRLLLARLEMACTLPMYCISLLGLL